MEARGRGAIREAPGFVEALRRDGVTAFIDKAGRRWSLHTYGSMVLRTTSRQAEVLSVLTQDPEWDLYKISSHGTTCKLCASYEGRVYSKSGNDPDFPPLSAAFGKRDRAGPDSLDNSWLNREKERGRARWLNDYRQWERYRVSLGDNVPRTFYTFLKHKRAGDEKYKAWKTAYRQANELEKYSRVRYHEDGTVVVTDTWKTHRSIPSQYKPNAIIETRIPNQQVDRTFYDSAGHMVLQVHSGDHKRPKKHPYGKHGEHAHVYSWTDGHISGRKVRELLPAERVENADILEDIENDG